AAIGWFCTLSLHDALPILGLGIAFPFRGRSPLSQPLQLACGPGDPGHTDLPWPAPSSPLAEAVPLVCLCSRRNRMATKSAGLVRSEEHTSELQSPCNLVCR